MPRYRAIEDDSTEFERNVRMAQDEAKWLTVPEFLAANEFVPEDRFSAMIEAVTNGENQEHARVRRFTRMDQNVGVPAQFAARVWVLYGLRHDGSSRVRPSDPPVGWIYIPHAHVNGVRVTLYVTHRVDIPEGAEAVFFLSDDVEEMWLVRKPLLACSERDRETARGGNTASRKERKCDACGIVRRSSMHRCGRCKKAIYCSRVCQTEAWKEHKKVCVPDTIEEAN